MGIKTRSMKVADSIPPVTAVPMAFVAPAPAPVAGARVFLSISDTLENYSLADRRRFAQCLPRPDFCNLQRPMVNI